MIPYYSVDPNLVGNINLGTPAQQASFRGTRFNPTVQFTGAGYTGYPPNINLPLNFQTNYAGQRVGPNRNATNSAAALADQADEFFKRAKGSRYGQQISEQVSRYRQNPLAYAQGVRPQGAGLGAVLTAGGELLEGNPAGAVIGGGIGLATAGLTNRLVGGLTTTAAKFLPGPLRAPVMIAGKTVLPYLAGETVTRTVANAIQGAPQTAEQTAQNVSNVVPATLSTMLGVQGFLDNLPGMADVDSPLYKGRRVRESRQREFLRDENLKDAQLVYGLNRQYLDDVERRRLGAMAEAQKYNQANLKLQKDIALELSRENAIQGQALLNTQGAISQGLLRTQGAIQLAGIGMQTGASMVNTFLSSSPYAKAVMAAPNVSINL